MQKFAIKIDMSVFFEDERKNAIILVDPGWKNVEKLQERVEQIFEVRNVRFLSNEGYFLPPQESIEVVKFVEKLKSFIPTKGLEEKKRKKTVEKCIITTNDELIMPPPVNELLPQKKRKLFSLQNGDAFFSSTPNQQAKRTKSIDVINAAETQSQFTSNKSSIAMIEQLDVIGDDSAAGNSKVRSQSKQFIENNYSSKQQSKEKTTAKCFDKKYISVSLETNNENTKREKFDETCYPHNDTTGALPACISLKKKNADQSSGIRTHKSKRTVEHNKKHYQSHILFDEDKETETTDPPKIPMHINFHCALAKIDMNKPRIFNPKSRPIIKIQEIVVLKSAKNQNTQSETCYITNKETKLVNLNQKNCPDIADIEANQLHGSYSERDKGEDEDPQLENKNENVQLQQSAYNEESVVALNSIEVQDDTTEGASQLNATNIIDLSETEDVEPSCEAERNREVLDATAENSKSSAVHFEEIKIANILPFCVELKTLPNIGDIVLFKTRFLNSSALSNFMAGRCEHINKRTKSLKLFLIDGLEEVIHLPAKYVCILDDSIDTMHINIKLTEMSEAKVFKMS